MDAAVIVPVRTDAGMLCVWSPTAFDAVNDYDSWGTHVNDRLHDAIASGDLVPLNIESDGSWGVRVALPGEGLSDRERTHEVITSEPYLLMVSGGEVIVSGIEGVGDLVRAPLRLRLGDGRYVVRTTLVAWDDEPGAIGPDGKPADTALPDFVVQIHPEHGSGPYRTNEITFDRPE
ncbi:MAG: hypothetical protein ACTHNQ_13830 [Microbacterium sp.]|uniref:hypothetical protein n=1 Tax=Microbacterium sp. TaxID=51671 RepID=UPI003F7E3EFF